MTQDEMKQAVATAALDYVVKDTIIGVGTGSTANFFIDALAAIKQTLVGAVASSEASAKRLNAHGITVIDLNSAGELSVYIDGADEVNPQLQLIKGGGGALTREKITAAAARQFICIADESKQVQTLGQFPLPIEVIPMAQNYVMGEINKRFGTQGVQVDIRSDVITDNGNIILDVSGLTITDAVQMETELNGIVGVVTNGLFASRGADVLLLGTSDGIKVIK